MRKLNSLWILPLILVACGSGLNVAIYRGDHTQERIERKVSVDGRTGWQFVNSSDKRFSEFQCLHDSEMWKVQELYNRAKKAGVKMDDL